jgi:hypothetical protein
MGKFPGSLKITALEGWNVAQCYSTWLEQERPCVSFPVPQKQTNKYCCSCLNFKKSQGATNATSDGCAVSKSAGMSDKFVCNELRTKGWGLKPALGNSLKDPTSKNPSQKKCLGGLSQGVGPEFKPQYWKKKKKKRTKEIEYVYKRLT